MPTDFLDFSGFFRALHTYGWWRVAIELLVIGAVVVWVTRFLRGTRGARMLKGIAVILNCPVPDRHVIGLCIRFGPY